jgi:hypothetical protein
VTLVQLSLSPRWIFIHERESWADDRKRSNHLHGRRGDELRMGQGRFRQDDLAIGEVAFDQAGGAGAFLALRGLIRGTRV